MAAVGGSGDAVEVAIVAAGKGGRKACGGEGAVWEGVGARETAGWAGSAALQAASSVPGLVRPSKAVTSSNYLPKLRFPLKEPPLPFPAQQDEVAARTIKPLSALSCRTAVGRRHCPPPPPSPLISPLLTVPVANVEVPIELGLGQVAAAVAASSGWEWLTPVQREPQNRWVGDTSPTPIG